MSRRDDIMRLGQYLAPPLARDLARSLLYRLQGSKREWEYVPEGWRAARVDPKIKGWNVPSVLDAYKANWPTFTAQLLGTNPLGIAPESIEQTHDNLISHNTMMSYGYALSYASRNRLEISMLDWGGGIGQYYMLSQKMVPGLAIDYHCKDVPVLADFGGQIFPDAHFYTDDTCLDRQYDFVLASSSLQYSSDWMGDFAALAKATAGYLFVTRLPVVLRGSSFVMVQRPYQYGYDTEYLGWCINRARILACAEAAGMQLVQEFIIGERPCIYKAPEQCVYRGFLFRAEMGAAVAQ